jgi:hypothetical protein
VRRSSLGSQLYRAARDLGNVLGPPAGAPVRGVLLLELLQALGVVGLHAAVPVAPPVIRGFGHLEVPRHRCHVRALVEHPVRFVELPDDLLGVCLRLAIVNILPSPIVGNGLSSRVDQSHEVGPISPLLNATVCRIVAHSFGVGRARCTRRGPVSYLPQKTRWFRAECVV